MTFYPSATPLRVAVQPPIVPDGEATTIPVSATLSGVVEDHGARLARNPFAGAWPVLIGDVVPVLRGDRLLVRDADGTALPIVTADVASRLLAISGGHPILLVAEWDGAWLRPLAAFADGRLASVTADADTIEVKIDDPDWSALVSAALLGTERTGGTAPIPTAVAGLVAGADTEQAILAAAASMAVRRRAGRTTSLDQAALPLPAEPDPRPQLSGPPARYVGLAFEERPSLAPEVLELVRRTGRRLPDEWLPDLMAFAERTDDADTALVHLGGTRAAWLARSFPTSPVMPGGGSGRTGRKPGRRPPAARRGQRSFAGFASWTCPAPDNSWRTTGRRSRPRNELASSPPSRRASTRRTKPSSPRRLADRRVDVRRTAAGLLVLLPESALTRRLEDEARPLLRRPADSSARA